MEFAFPLAPVSKLCEEYHKHGLIFDTYLQCHLQHGFVFSTPELFVMGRPVRRAADPGLIRNPHMVFAPEARDAWWIHGFAGDMSKLVGFMPWRLEWVGFERFDEIPRFYELERIVQRANAAGK